MRAQALTLRTMSPDFPIRPTGAQKLSLLHAGPSAGFDEPFEMLRACHERVQRMLGLLMRLLDHLGKHGVDAQAQAAARDVVRYFDVSGPAHHEDEEQHVLPALLAGDRPEAQNWAQRLHEEHLEMTRRWSQIRQDLHAVIDAAAGSTWSPPTSQDIAERWKDFERLYVAHIDLEESCAYPLAASRLSPEQVALMGEEMATRRGVNSMAPTTHLAAQNKPKRVQSS